LANERQDSVGADLSRPPPIYRPLRTGRQPVHCRGDPCPRPMVLGWSPCGACPRPI